MSFSTGDSLLDVFFATPSEINNEVIGQGMGDGDAPADRSRCFATN